MIKKRYVVAFVLLFLVVTTSSFITYKKNYSLYLNETKRTVKNVSNSVTYMYDSIFSSICNSTKQTIENLEQNDLSRSDIDELLYTASKDNYYINNMYIVFEDGTTINGFKEPYVDMKSITPYFEREGNGICLGLIKSSKSDSNLFYGVTPIEFQNKKKALLLVGINYDLINNISRADSYEVYEGYLYLLSNDGYFLYHKDPLLIGKNLFTDKKFIKDVTNMDDDSYNYLIKIIKNKNKESRENMISYRAYNVEKIGYYNYLDSFDGTIMLSINYTQLKHKQIKATMRIIIPLLISFLIATYILLKYIFLVKYTDYFTEVKNELAFKKRIKKLHKQGKDNENYLIIKVENVTSNKDEEFLYDNSIYYYVSKYFKSISSLYIDLYRISRVHYVFVLKDENSLKQIEKLLHNINKNISIDNETNLFIRGKQLLLTIDDIKELENFEVVPQIIQYMEKNYEDLKIISDTGFTKYSNILNKSSCRLKDILLLERVIVNQNIVPFYQPIVELKTEKIIKYEVLMRVKHNNEYLTPAKFIEIAESEDRIEEIDRLVMRQAFQTYYRRLHKTGKHMRLSINLSGKSINQNMIDYILKIIYKYNIDPSNITFELTETAALNNLNECIWYLNKLRDKGFKLAIDDFGTGYAHVELLSKLEVDYIKIDGAFIKGVENDGKLLKTLNALVYISKNYDAKIIAEYVENKEVIKVLEKLGVEYGQGYYFGKPEPIFT
ncbi:EAL domain-containing protein [Tepidibacter hydrothermalis]|uniref:EAL domain-containing protein n=1 Tax=Tepidibacter hydrothermalis TaxID=3036126 RepID=A0ABY8EDS3_9FIRM|nr:EAL domain-containing protein [Tepidibacter hydrothermalis]WFD11092.1 EAL domain-containing protein [Tepidibacter hydrothermalis]